MLRLAVALLLLPACAEELPTLTTAPLVEDSEPPEAGFDVDEGDVWVTPGLLTGWVADAEQAPATLPLTLTSSRDGLLWRGNPGGDGEWAWQGELTPGEHGLLLEVVDREGNLVQAETRVFARTNLAPTCRILEPRGGGSVRVRTDVTFLAQADDGDGDALRIFWRSDLEGPLFEGSTFTRRFTRVGEHRVTIEVEDGVGGACTDEVLVEVLP